MDINNTYFHLLTGEENWQPILDQKVIGDLWWDREQNSLSLLPQVLRFPQRPSEKQLTAEDRRGAASDRYGNIYWIDADDQGSIRSLPAGTQEAGDFWHIRELLSAKNESERHGDFQPLTPATEPVAPLLRGLAVTRHHYLVAGTLEPAGLLVFDLHAGGTPVWIKWPEAVPFAPFDLCPAPDGGLWVLDRNLSSEQGRAWYLDRYFRVHAVNGTYLDLAPTEHDDFEPVDGEPAACLADVFPTASEIDTASPVQLRNPIAIEALADGSVLILGSGTDESYSVIQRYVNGEETNTILLKGPLFKGMLEDPKLKAHDFAFVELGSSLPGIVTGELSLILDNGNQAFVFGLEADGRKFTLAMRPRYLPVRQFSGKALVPSGQYVYYDLDQRWYLLTAQPRNRYVNKAKLDSLQFDGKQPGCIWHRIVIDGCIPDGAAIEFESRTADEKDELIHNDWRPEPLPYRRSDGPEIHLHRPFTKAEQNIAGTGTWEWLIQDARGRYLELRMRFKSNGRQTPRIRSMRVYYPRFSYLSRFLPAIYTEQDQETHFLERYLANTEGFFSTIEDRIARAQSLLDTRTAPKEFLEWLAGWFGAMLDEDWDEPRQRLFIDNAELLFRWHGTQIGMRAAIHLAIDPCPDESIFEELNDERSHSLVGAAGGSNVRIVERFLYRDLPGVYIGDPTANSGLKVVNVDAKAFKELGEKEHVNNQYRNFLYRRYNANLVGFDDPLDALNLAWERKFESFDEIVFDHERPQQATEIVDWYQFIQRELALTQTWDPAHGVYALHARYQESLRKQYSLQALDGQQDPDPIDLLNQNWGTGFTSFEEIGFSPVEPGTAAIADDWNRFIQSDLGFSYARVTASDVAAYREFLSRRYHLIDRLNEAYGLLGDDRWPVFADISLPQEDDMPSSQHRLHDWIQFVSLMLPIRRNAHRFTVLVPTEPGELPDSRDRRLSQVKAIVNHEKPAHTDFDVKLYWALFMVGSARLGQDTVLGEGARYAAIVLGGSYIGQDVVGYSHPWNIQDRILIDRDRLPRSTQGEINNE